jgi:hypothetical protein
VALTDSLVAWYRLDEASGTRADSSGNGYTLTDNNTVGSATGNMSALAADFVAASSESLSGTHAGLIAPFTIAAAWSWVLWIYPETPIESALANPISTYNGTKGVMCRRRGQTSFGSSTIAWDIANDAGTLKRIEGTANTPKDSWSMIALVYNGSGSAFSRTNASTSGNTTGISGTLTPHTTFRLGTRAVSPGGDQWDGRIGHVGLWSRALTSGELDQLYNSGAGLDPTAPVASGQPAAARGVLVPGMNRDGRRVLRPGWG